LAKDETGVHIFAGPDLLISNGTTKAPIDACAHDYPGFACPGFKAAEVFCKMKGYVGLSKEPVTAKPPWSVMDVNDHEVRLDGCSTVGCFTEPADRRLVAGLACCNGS